MNKDVNKINWFEIPVKDLDRAATFYQTIFGFAPMERMEMMGMVMAFFPWTPGDGKVSGGLVIADNYEPSMNGVVIYLNADPDLEAVASKVEAAGGKLLLPKTPIGENGFMAFFADTEGNRIGLHSNG